VSYKIPPEKEVYKVMEKLLSESLVIHSQTKMQTLLIDQLTKSNPNYHLSGTRMRRIAARAKNVVLEIRCRTAKQNFKGSICPVCGAEMKATKNKTLYNWDVVVGAKCRTCGYWTGTQKRVPIRYIFRLKD